MPFSPGLKTKQLRRNSVLLDAVLSGAWAEEPISSYAIPWPVQFLRKWTQEGDGLSKLMKPTTADQYDSYEQLGCLMNDTVVEDPTSNEERQAGGIVIQHVKQQGFSATAGIGVASPTSQRTAFDSKSTDIHSPSSPLSIKQALAVIDSAAPKIPSIDIPNRLAKVSNTATSPGGPEQPDIETVKKFRVSIEDPCYKVLPALLKKYHINDDWQQYRLLIVYGDGERGLNLDETPLALFKQLEKEGRKPVCTLRKTACIPTDLFISN